jgi:hypothetical protein
MVMRDCTILSVGTFLGYHLTTNSTACFTATKATMLADGNDEAKEFSTLDNNSNY